MTSFFNALPGAVAQGLIWGIMAIGVYITYKILDASDLTVDGSFCTGGAVCAMAFLMNNPLIILVAGIIYIVEAGSVMLQVFYYKITKGKRLFKMSPIHHHFERCGWSENKIVAVFSIISVCACVLAYLFGR